ncbi:hypothetical protein B6U67_04125 [Methanosarcinales archaeon ex4484_138]|nr:MAG: hypothetical protein B6U67_04125 [Methanosarcinales archaeon ex4484_138]
MAIKQPNSIIGNSQLLATLGMKGEIFNIYYPRRDHAQHVADALLAINTYGNYHWLNTIDWQSKQYHPCGNGILKTDLSHFSGIAVSITDTIPPRYPVFMRCFEIDNNEIEGSFYTYFDFEVGGMREKNAGFYDEENDILVQYWQNNYVGVVTTPPFDEWQLGKTLDTAWWTSAKWGIERGELQKNKEEIGNMNMAARFPLETKEIIEYIIFAETREELYNLKDSCTRVRPSIRKMRRLRVLLESGHGRSGLCTPDRRVPRVPPTFHRMVQKDTTTGRLVVPAILARRNPSTLMGKLRLLNPDRRDRLHNLCNGKVRQYPSLRCERRLHR